MSPSSCRDGAWHHASSAVAQARSTGRGDPVLPCTTLPWAAAVSRARGWAGIKGPEVGGTGSARAQRERGAPSLGSTHAAPASRCPARRRTEPGLQSKKIGPLRQPPQPRAASGRSHWRGEAGSRRDTGAVGDARPAGRGTGRSPEPLWGVRVTPLLRAPWCTHKRWVPPGQLVPRRCRVCEGSEERWVQAQTGA